MSSIANDIFQGMISASRPSLLWTQEDSPCLPELTIAHAVMQKGPQSVFCHTMKVLDLIQNKNIVTLFAALFHDLGKVKTVRYGIGKKNFHGHEMLSEDIARHYLNLWGVDQDTISSVAKIIRSHMFDIYSCGQKNIRRFIGTVGIKNITNWFDLRIADHLAYTDTSRVNHRIVRFKNAVKQGLSSSESQTQHYNKSAMSSLGSLKIVGAKNG